MQRKRIILHGGALGDAVLSVQLALRAWEIRSGESLTIVSRTSLTGFESARPAIVHCSSEGCGWHWLYSSTDDPPPKPLESHIRGNDVLSFLSGPDSPVARRIESLAPASAYHVDPSDAAAVSTGAAHITHDWSRQLTGQGFLMPACSRKAARSDSVGFAAVETAIRRQKLEDPFGLARDQTRVLIHPGSGGARKSWPVESFLGVARELSDRGIATIFGLGPIETETWSDNVRAALRSVGPLVSFGELRSFVDVVRGVDALLGNDSGPAHVAALAGVPTITIFGPTCARAWRPLSRLGRVLTGQPELGPSWGLSVEAVAGEVEALARA